MRASLICVMSCLLSMRAYAAPAGALDPAFGLGFDGTPGLTARGFDTGNANARSMVRDNQGRLYIVGPVSRPGDSPCVGLMRFSKDGIPDTGFGVDGRLCLDNTPAGAAILFSSEAAFDAAFDGNGRLLVSGHVNAGEHLHPFVCRLFTDGMPDATFNALGTPGCIVLTQFDIAWPNFLSTVSVVPVGNALYLGATILTNDVPHPALMKLDGTGTLLPIGQGGFVNLLAPAQGEQGELTDVVDAGDGGLLATGAVRNSEFASNDAFIARVSLSTDALDPAFAGMGRVRLDVGIGERDDGRAIGNTLDGKAVVAVRRESAAAVGTVVLLRVATATGVLDASLGGTAGVALSPCSASPPAVCDLTPTATMATADSILTVAQGSIGEASGTAVIRTAATGMLDTGFAPETNGAVGTATFAGIGGGTGFQALLLQDDRIVVGGVFQPAGAHAGFGVARLLGSPTPDMFADGFESNP